MILYLKLAPLLVFLKVLTVSSEEKYNWYSIILYSPNGETMALDIDEDRKTCPRANVILCPLDKFKGSQKWRWDDNMLKSFDNGYVMTVSDLNRVIVTYPQGTQNQQFFLKKGKKYIYADKKRSGEIVLQPAHGALTSGTRVKVCNAVEKPYQLFEFKRANA